MQIHQLKRKTAEKKKKYIGRGGKRGTTSGKGTKGQKARAGRKLRPEIRDIIKKLPKKRGYKFASIRSKAVPVNLVVIESKMEAGDINPQVLVDAGLVNLKKGKMPTVKILATGAVTKKFVVSGCLVSASAKEKIEKAGGSVAE